MNLREFSYREETVPLKEIFPEMDVDDFKSTFKYRTVINDHLEIFDTAVRLWKAGYPYILGRYGFHDSDYKKFSGHCHQITPMLGAVLLAKGFEEVVYLEAYLADPKTGEKVDPKEEKTDMRQEFCAIDRIPYCALLVITKDGKVVISGKHIKEEKGKMLALLTPSCYQEFDFGVFAHQNDSSRSGIYLAQIMDFPGVENGKPFVWKKQKMNLKTGQPDEPEEFFKTFAHMKLTF